MSIQSLTGASSLVAIGVGAGDIATLFTLGHRMGNWLTAGSGDADFLSMLEEDEVNILRRRGAIDMIRFKKRWGKSLRLLANGVPQRVEGHAVEKLVDGSSKFTASMMCIVAALDEFAAASTVRNVLKGLLTRLIPSTEVMEDLLLSQLGTRINAWRSAATVREMNIKCRKIHQHLLQQGLILDGYMSDGESFEVADFLYWLLAEKSEVRYTASSDVAGIAFCLTHLSFEILTIEGFGMEDENRTVCNLVYSKAPLFSGRGTSIPDDRRTHSRELSTTVSLTQADETFSTFPIERGVANRCRVAWQEGAKAARDVCIKPEESTSRLRPDLIFHLSSSEGNDNLPRVEAKIYNIAQVFSFHPTLAVCEGISRVLGKETDDILENLVWITDTPPFEWIDKAPGELAKPDFEIAFNVFQAFFMGYYYDVFLKIIDTSALEVKAVSGAWGYKSVKFFRRMRAFNIKGKEADDARNSLAIRRADMLSIMGILFANVDVETGKEYGRILASQRPDDRGLCVGVVGKRIILANSLLKSCEIVEEVGKFVLLDTDAGSIPHNPQGIILTGVPSPFPIWEDQCPAEVNNVKLRGPQQDFTRHIETDWDGNPERLLLCIRYKGRRIGSLDPGMADIMFCKSFIEPTAQQQDVSPFGPVYECDIDDFVISGRLVAYGSKQPNVPVIVQSKGSPCMRYAAIAWYTDAWGNNDCFQINGCPHAAMKYAEKSDKHNPSMGKQIVLVA